MRFLQRLTALPCSMSLLALAGRQGIRGLPVEETTGTHGWLEALEVCFFLLLGEGEGGMMRSCSMLLLRLEACKAVQ